MRIGADHLPWQRIFAATVARKKRIVEAGKRIFSFIARADADAVEKNIDDGAWRCHIFFTSMVAPYVQSGSLP